MRAIGRLGLSVLSGAWAVAFWAAAFGAHPVQPAGDYSWWPGALYSILIAALVFAALQSRPALADSLQRVFGSDVPVWAAAAAIGLLWLVRLRWAAPMAGEVAMEMLAIGLGGMLVAGLTAPARPVQPKTGLPYRQSSPATASAESTTRTLAWRGRGRGLAPAEAYAVDVQIDTVRLEAQRVAPHDLIEARWSGYCTVTPEIEQLARELRAISEREHLDRLDEVRLVLDMVGEGGDLGSGPLYPLESLAGEQAGAGARGILAATLLSALGYRPALLRAGGERTAIAVAGVAPLPELFLHLEGEPAVFAEFGLEGYSFGDVPDRDRAVAWHVVPLRK